MGVRYEATTNVCITFSNFERKENMSIREIANRLSYDPSLKIPILDEKTSIDDMLYVPAMNTTGGNAAGGLAVCSEDVTGGWADCSADATSCPDDSTSSDSVCSTYRTNITDCQNGYSQCANNQVCQTNYCSTCTTYAVNSKVMPLDV